jgi:hypothetical protein
MNSRKQMKKDKMVNILQQLNTQLTVPGLSDIKKIYLQAKIQMLKDMLSFNRIDN